MKRVFTKSDFKKFCQICGRHGHEDESCAAIPTTFTWKYGGEEVYLCGSFSQWQTKKRMYKENDKGPFKVELSLAPATYQYKFIVDGVWKFDVALPHESDGLSGQHNFMRVMPAEFEDVEEQDNEEYFIYIKNQKNPDTQYKIIKLIYPAPAVWVAVKGSWDNWNKQIVLKKVKNFEGEFEFYVTLKIAPGNYQFKFISDGAWNLSSYYPVAEPQGEIVNNLLIVPSYSTLACPKPTNLESKIYLNWRREEGKWTECGRIHHTLQGHSMNIICDTIYIFGGMANGKFTNTLYTFDPRTNEFNVVEDQAGDIPSPRAFHHTSVFGTKILVYGGFNEQYLTDYYSFNTVTQTWTQSDINGEHCPCPRERSTLVPYIEDKLVLFGGYYCSPDMEVETYLDDVYVMDLSMMEWIKPAVKHDENEQIQPRSAHTANFVKGKMYVFGGLTNKQKNLNDMWMLRANPSGLFQWKKIEPKGAMPDARHGHSSVTANTNIIYYGGRGNGYKSFFDKLFIFDTLNELWIYPLIGGTKPTPRYYHASVLMHENTEMVIFGGIRPKEFLNYPRMYILQTDANAAIEEQDEKVEKDDN